MFCRVTQSWSCGSKTTITIGQPIFNVNASHKIFTRNISQGKERCVAIADLNKYFKWKRANLSSFVHLLLIGVEEPNLKDYLAWLMA